MKKVLLTLLLTTALICISQAQIKITDDLALKLNGVFNTWFQWQKDFIFGKADYNDRYVVQMLRFIPQLQYKEDIKLVTRFDIAQGWWGVDNVPPTRQLFLKASPPDTINSASLLFDNKDTNYPFHVDQAYVWVNVPKLYLSFQVGRMQFLVGNRMLIDNNYDGVQVDINLGKLLNSKNIQMLKLGWAKVSEGVDALSDLSDITKDGSSGLKKDYWGNTDARDANLLLANLSLNFKNGNYETKVDLYGFYYADMSTMDNVAYIPNALQYKRARFAPQVTDLLAFGLSGMTKYNKLTLNYELNYLYGKDDIRNTSYGPTLDIDINDGNLRGYNIYLKANYAVTDVVNVGGVFGFGSGDSDGPWGGKGNVNKLRTAGFFYITEVWEDSIMPDEEGITPQGLGAPNVRGYREIENTTIGQVNLTVKPVQDLTLFGSFSLIRATQPIYAWDEVTNIQGDPQNLKNARSAKDIGWEIDLKGDYKLHKKVTLTLRGGYFKPGKAAMFLINGTDKWNKSAWELKGEITYEF